MTKKRAKLWKWTIAGAAIVLFCSLFLRLYKLDNIPVFADEAIYIRWAQIMRTEPTLRFLPLSDGKQPLFMWATMPALKVFDDPLIAGRAVSVATGLGTTVGIFVLTYIFFNSRKASLLASLLYTLSPFAVFFDRMALVDSMLSFFGVWMFIFSILAIENLRLDFAMLAGFSLGGAMLTKSPAIFFALLLPSVLVFTPVKLKRKIELKKVVIAACLLLVIYIISWGIYNILRLGPNFHLIGSRNYDYVFPYSHIFQNPLNPFISHINTVLEWYETMGPSTLVLLALAGVFGNFSKHKRALFVLCAWAIIPVLIQAEFAKVLTSRYILFTLPPLVILGASVLKKFKKPPVLYGVYLAVALVIAQSFMFFVPYFYDLQSAKWPEREGYLANWTAGTGIREAAEIIKAKKEANPNLQIVVGTEGYFGTLPDGLQMYLANETGITVIGVGLGFYQIPLQLVEAKEAGNVVYLVGNLSRMNFSGTFEENGLREVASFEKAPRDEGTHSYVEYGPQDTFYLLEVI